VVTAQEWRSPAATLVTPTADAVLANRSIIRATRESMARRIFNLASIARAGGAPWSSGVG
jgi:hypothetical protein